MPEFEIDFQYFIPIRFFAYQARSIIYWGEEI